MLLDTGVNEIVLGKIMQILIILLPYLFYGRLSKLNQLVFEPKLNDVYDLLVQSLFH
jgi:hypothetical protein